MDTPNTVEQRDEVRIFLDGKAAVSIEVEVVESFSANLTVFDIALETTLELVLDCLRSFFTCRNSGMSSSIKLGFNICPRNRMFPIRYVCPSLSNCVHSWFTTVESKNNHKLFPTDSVVLILIEVVKDVSNLLSS